jgi:hypothetical protein
MVDGGNFRLQPGVEAGFPDIHGAAHDDQEVKGGEVGDWRAFIERHRIPCMARFCPEIAENAWVFDGQVLEDENTHEKLRLLLINMPAALRQGQTQFVKAGMVPMPICPARRVAAATLIL